MAEAATAPLIDHQLRHIAARLDDVAATVRNEADATTAAIREAGTHAETIAALASELEGTADLVAATIADHLALLARARETAAHNGLVLQSLAGTADTIAAMSHQITEIAGRSRFLALNARIEAARAGVSGTGFAVVAGEMTTLAARTRTATHDIAERASTVGNGVETARGAIAAATALVVDQEASMATLADTATRQRDGASSVAALTRQAVAQVDDAAVRIGRTASAAGILGLLARQMLRLADEVR